MKPVSPSESWESRIGTASTALSDGFLRGRPTAAPLPLSRQRTALTERSASDQTSRRKIWDLDKSLHCSVIGTCLSTGELRALIRKFVTLTDGKTTDHDFHKIAVSSVHQRDILAKQIQKALDRRHAGAIRRLGEAKSAAEVRRLWAEAKQSGEIPGAYWAVLTHPRTDEALACDVFGDVHMLSHLVGAANRADIRRLHQLEEEKTALEDTLARQQTQLRDGIIARDSKIRELSDALSAQIEDQNSTRPSARSGSGAESEIATLHSLVVDLRKLLDRETGRRERAEARVEELAAAHAKSESARVVLADEVRALRDELDALEAQLRTATTEEAADPIDLAGTTILYVGGRPHQITQLRAVVERASGTLLHHDGGVEEHLDLLPGLVSRADLAFFPVDCISHRAALSLKRLCQQAGKTYVPLRSAGVASMLRALRKPDLVAARSAAE